MPVRRDLGLPYTTLQGMAYILLEWLILAHSEMDTERGGWGSGGIIWWDNFYRLLQDDLFTDDLRKIKWSV